MVYSLYPGSVAKETLEGKWHCALYVIKSNLPSGKKLISLSGSFRHRYDSDLLMTLQVSLHSGTQ